MDKGYHILSPETLFIQIKQMCSEKINKKPGYFKEQEYGNTNWLTFFIYYVCSFQKLNLKLSAPVQSSYMPYVNKEMFLVIDNEN